MLKITNETYAEIFSPLSDTIGTAWHPIFWDVAEKLSTPFIITLPILPLSVCHQSDFYGST